MAAPWPYDDKPTVSSADEPTWKCPGGLCECHPPDLEADDLEFSIMLCDESGKSMPGARVRIIQQDRVLNEDDPNADSDGWITALVKRSPETVLLEWAPADTPQEPRYPYRCEYYVELAEDDREEAARRRLSNLGFSLAFDLEGNVRRFQDEFNYEETGVLSDIEADLISFHDEATVPETDDEDESGSQFQLVSSEDPKKKKAEKKSRPDPKGKGKAKTGGSKAKPGQGTGKKPRKVTINVFAFFSLGLKAPMKSGTKIKAQRWGAGSAHPVAKAEIRIFDSSGTLQKPPGKLTVGKFGQVSADLTKVKDGDYTFLVLPSKAQELHAIADRETLATGSTRTTLLTPVGPSDHFKSDTLGNMRFRMLELDVTLKGGLFVSASVSSDMSHTLPNKGKTVHGGALREDAQTLWVDYKPDFIQIANKTAKQKAKRPSERKNKKAKPVLQNLFIHLHHTEGPTPGSALEDFINKTIKGAHYLVDVDGFVIKLTDESFRANHAGKAHWYDLDSGKIDNTIAVFNDLSVGIEQVNEEGDDYPANQVSATSELVGRLRKALKVSRHNVLNDGETALNFDDKRTQKSLGRKVDCPGPTYPWSVLEKAGNATNPAVRSAVPHDRYGDFFKTDPTGEIDASASTDAIDGLQLTLSELGYFVNSNSTMDNATIRAVEAFQNRYFSGPDRAKLLAAVKGSKTRPIANLATISRMHAVLADRGGFEYE